MLPLPRFADHARQENVPLAALSAIPPVATVAFALFPV
jgi:hypothetical protein